MSSFKRNTKYMFQDLLLAQHIHQAGLATGLNTTQQTALTWHDIFEACTEMPDSNRSHLDSMPDTQFVVHPHQDMLIQSLLHDEAALLRPGVNTVHSWKGWLQFLVRILHERQAVLAKIIESCESWLTSNPLTGKDSRRPGFVALQASMTMEYRHLGKLMSRVPCPARFRRHRASVSFGSPPVKETADSTEATAAVGYDAETYASYRLSIWSAMKPLVLPRVALELKDTLGPAKSVTAHGEDAYSGESIIQTLLQSGSVSNADYAQLLATMLVQSNMIVSTSGNEMFSKYCFKPDNKTLYCIR